MRTIKFRGKRVNRNGEWAYGDLRQLPDRVLIVPSQSDDAAIDRDTVDPDTIGQFTGLYDKNDKEIYEGDIVSITLHHNKTCKSSYNAVVKQTEGTFGFGNVNGFAPFYGSRESEYEVIGNIYDNSELIKK